ncbi:hypothetical protein [Phormidesmis priestleyi]
MNEYFTSLRAIAQSSTELLTDQYHSVNSLEIKQSATTLRNSIQPCLDDLLQAQVQLGRNLIGCMKTLEHSEAVWQSKQQVIVVSNFTILEKVGEISGCWNRIQQLAAQEKLEIVEQVKQNWLDRIEELEKSFFFDSKNQRRAGIGFGDKNGFRRELPYKVNYVSGSLDDAVKETLHQLLQELNIRHLDAVQTFVDLLDPELKSKISQEKEDLLTELKSGFDRKLDNLADKYTLSQSQGMNCKIAEWQQRFGDIFWEEVASFRDQGLTKIERRVELVINDRLAMLQKVVKWALTFYNYFLSLQKRYQQETPGQRTAEKAWIDQQRQQLKQLLANVELSLK